jgi:integrase
MTRRSLPPYVYAKGRKGFLYFSRAGVLVRMPDDPASAEFAAAYAQARAAVPVPVKPKGDSFAALVAHYKASPRYTKLAPRTRSDYDKVLAFIVDRLGHLPPGKMRRKDVVRARDANAETVRFANYLVQVLRVLMEHARDIGWRDDNPAKGVALIQTGKIDRQAWPEAMIAAYRAAAPVRALLIFEMCIGTGQRIGDVLRMRWDHVEAGGIHVRQGKTRRPLWVPLTGRLAALLAETPRRGLTILCDDAGRPLRYWQARHAVAAVRAQIGAEAYDIHALRYSTAAELAGLGCSDDLIMAVTGHSTPAMVAKYAGPARQKVRAIRAQEKRE